MVEIITRHTNPHCTAPRCFVSANGNHTQIIVVRDGRLETVFTGPQFDEAAAKQWEDERPHLPIHRIREAIPTS